jgi:hypothetical protein
MREMLIEESLCGRAQHTFTDGFRFESPGRHSITSRYRGIALKVLDDLPTRD